MLDAIKLNSESNFTSGTSTTSSVMMTKPSLLSILFPSEKEREQYYTVLMQLHKANQTRLSEENNAEIYQQIASYLMELGNIYADHTKNFEDNKEKINVQREYICHASLMYNAALVVARKKASPSLFQQEINQKIINLEKFLLKLVGASEVNAYQENHTSFYKSRLEKLRASSEEQLKKIDEDASLHGSENGYTKRAKSINNIYKEINIELNDIFKHIIENAINQLGEPPCKFTIILLGSLAKESATPYSDIEFGILIEDKNAELNKVNKKYFRDLSALVALQVMALGETSIPFEMLKSKDELLISQDLDDLIRPGFQFDLGGKTPLNRKRLEDFVDPITKNTIYPAGSDKYDLINTPEKMAAYVKDEGFEIDKLLPIEMTSFKFLYGDKTLTEEYDKKVWEFLERKIDEHFFHEKRALQILSKGWVGIKADLEKYAPFIENEIEEGKFYNVKQEIYRFPDRMIEGLRLYFGVKSNSNRNAIKKMGNGLIKGKNAKQNIFSSSGERNLLIIDAIAKEMRLRTYLSNKSQREKMMVLEDETSNISDMSLHNRSDQDCFNLPERDINEEGIIFRFYYTVLPFYKSMYNFCRQGGDVSFLKNDNFFNDDFHSKGFIHKRLLHFQAAKDCFEKYLQQKGSDKETEMLLGQVLLRLGNPKEGLKYFTKSNEDDFITYSNRLNAEGRAFYDLGYFAEAEEKWQEAYRNYTFLGLSTHINAANILGNLGLVLQELGKFNLGREALEAALKIKKDFYSENHPIVADTLHNIGLNYQSAGELHKALDFLLRSLNIRTNFYRGKHPDLISSFRTIGGVYQRIGDFERSLKYKEHALSLSKCLYPKFHPEVAKSYSSLGIFFLGKGNFEDGIKNLNKAFSIFDIDPEDHPEKAKVIGNIGISYLQCNKFNESIKRFQQALEMHKRMKSENNINFVENLFHLSICYYKLKEFYKSLTYFNKVIKFFINNELNLEHSIFKQTMECMLLDIRPVLINSVSSKDRERKVNYSKFDSSFIDDNIKEIVNFFDTVELEEYKICYYLLIKNYKDVLPEEEVEKKYLPLFEKDIKECPDVLSYILLGYTCKEIGKYAKAIQAFMQAEMLYQQRTGKEHSLAEENAAICLSLIKNSTAEDTDQETNYVLACPVIIYDNPLLGDPHIATLLNLAKTHFGLKGVNELISIGLESNEYIVFQNYRKQLGDEAAIRLHLSSKLITPELTREPTVRMDYLGHLLGQEQYEVSALHDEEYRDVKNYLPMLRLNQDDKFSEKKRDLVKNISGLRMSPN